MNKGELKKFAINARNKLREQCIQVAGIYGLSKDVITPETKTGSDYAIITSILGKETTISTWQKQQRDIIIAKIKQEGFDQVIEEVAYTIFNRLIAIRFMEVNDYLPSHTRVLSSLAPGQVEPDLVFYAPDVNLPLTDAEREQINELKDKNALDELFKLLFIKQCNELGKVLPGLFTPIEGYIEFLFALRYTQMDGVIKDLLAIPEEDFREAVEIIGWMYQYYNSEPKDHVFANLKKNIKITKDTLPAATQLFTPDWIVRYMVENSLGRLWLEGHPNVTLQSGWKYYLEEAKQEPAVVEQLQILRAEKAALQPEDIKAIDPCMGSGHILVYMFEVLMQIYLSCGYTAKDAVQNIVAKNLYGLDIDDRAAQLAYFAVMMKARQYDRLFLTRAMQPHVYSIQESNNIDSYVIEYFANNDKDIKKNISNVLDALHDAKEYGSIINIGIVDFDLLEKRFEEIKQDTSIYKDLVLCELLPLVKSAQILAQQYHAVVTNPPYMGASNMGAKLSEFVKTNYPDSKSDLFAVFIERCGTITIKNGYQAMITQHAWMFLSSFEKLRSKILTYTILNMAHLGARAFEEIGGEVVQTTSFVLKREHLADYKGKYCRLIGPTTQQGKEDMFLAGENRYESDQENFSKIPGSPIAYWVSGKIMQCFENKKIGEVSNPKQGMIPGNVEEFLRIWYEVNLLRIGFGHKKSADIEAFHFKWFPYNKGGSYRRWYGNIEHIINMENNGYDIKFSGRNNNFRLRDPSLYFQDAITWSKISSGDFSARYMPGGCLFDIAGCCVFGLKDKLKYTLGFIDSKVSTVLLGLISPTLNFEVDHIKKLPFLFDVSRKNKVEHVVANNLDISKSDWDSFETSWDFAEQPFVKWSKGLWDATAIGACMSRYYDGHPQVNSPMELCYMLWKGECAQRFNKLKDNEEELNRIFIEIYGLQDELTPEEEDKDVTVHYIADSKEDAPEGLRSSSYLLTKQDVVKSFISYAVGCMFGRYSLYQEGLFYAGGEWNTDTKYALLYYLAKEKGVDDPASNAFLPDEDNIIPITDEDYFADDIVGRFVDFVEKVYGEETLEANLKFIADALGGGGLPRDVLRKYFLGSFFKDHVKTYQKRPIYWLFDSGKKNGFKALIYLHRYNEDTVGKVRVDYLHKIQHKLEEELKGCHQLLAMDLSAADKSKNNKRITKIEDQLTEIHAYDEVLAHMASKRVKLDLDDGVKVNYAKLQGIEVASTDGRTRKVNLLASI